MTTGIISLELESVAAAEQVLALDVPPRWAVVAVKVCVVGMLLMPLCIPPVALAANALLGAQAENFRMAACLASVAIWATMVACARILTSHYPPVPRK
jgi:hypothetical protein